MGNCVQCYYPLITKKNYTTNISSLNSPQIVLDNDNLSPNITINNIINLKTENSLNKSQYHKDKTLNHGTTLEKNEPSEENISGVIVTKKESFKKKKSNKLLKINSNKIINKRPGTVNVDGSSESSRKYNKLQSFTRQLSTESFLRAKTKGDKIIEQIPQHLGPVEIPLEKGDFPNSSELKKTYSQNVEKTNFYFKKVSNISSSKKQKRLSVIKEEEDEDRRNSMAKVGNYKFNLDNRIINKLKNVNIFKNNFDNNQLHKLLSIISEYEIQTNNDIICKGEIGSSFFILDEGEIKIYDNDLKKDIIIKNEYNFGQICLVSPEEINRSYNVTSLTKIKLFIIENDKFNIFINKENVNINKIDISYFRNIDFFKNFYENDLILLSKFCSILNENEIKNNKSGNKYITLKEFFNSDIQSILQKYYIKFEIFNNNNDTTISFEPKKIINCSQYLIIPINILFELFGFDIKKKIIQNTFYNLVKNEHNILKNFNTNIPQINSVFYSLFKLKCLNKESNTKIKIINKDFMLLLIDGNVKFYHNEELIEEHDSIIFIDTKKIKNKNKMYFTLNSIILYSNYSAIHEKSKELQNFYNDKLSIFRSFSFFNLFKEDELFQLIHLINEKTYDKDYIIMNEHKCENFYLIISGKVKHKFKNNETIMIYCDGECFGESFLLDAEGMFLKDSFIIVASDKLTTLEIPKEIFFQMLQMPKINDYIKVKMCLEDKSISLSDLYYVTTLGKGKFGEVYMVHNGIFIYAIKVVSRSFIRNKTKASNYLQNENNILKYLHNQFIIKLVKTFKNKHFFFFLMEYSTGSQLDKILGILSESMNINIVKFYASLLFLILDYLSKQKIIHRDIKPSNIMVDSSGYIKLVDFGAAKRILNGYAKTMIGTPFFMAPEIISGEHYSFPADYFSVGVCLYYIYYKKYPFGMGKPDVYSIYQDILKKQVSFIDLNNQNNSLNDLIKNLLDKEPSVRISNLKSIKNHSFFKNFDWDAIVTKKSDPPYLPTNGKNYTEQYLDNTSRHFEQFIEERKNELIKNDENYKDDDIKSERSKTSNESSWMDELF